MPSMTAATMSAARRARRRAGAREATRTRSSGAGQVAEARTARPVCTAAQARTRRCGDDVEDREDERARDDRRVRASLDRAMREDDADGVPARERDDRVDADPGEIRAEDRAPLDASHPGTRRRARSPRHARARELRRAARARRGRAGSGSTARELVEECVDPVEDADHARMRSSGGR